MVKFTNLVGEKEVEHFWWSVLREFFPKGTLKAREAGHKTDGILIDIEHEILTLIEVKEDLDLQKPSEQAKVLIQSIFYIKQFELAGEKKPKTVFIGDKNEAFIVHTNSLLKYLDYEIDWSTAPSQAYKTQVDMLMDISDDANINPYVFDISVPDFNFYTIMDKLIELNQDIKRLIKITERNIQQVFDYFIQNVLGANKLNVNEQVNLFIDLLINPSGNYLHPRKKNSLISNSFGELKVNQNKFNAFFSHFDGEQYSVLQKEKLVSIVDRLIEDESRKRNGEFFTPAIWVDEAHDMISVEFGADWKEKYVVWDCAWGTGNLTRDYNFGELYCSSLHQSDIDTANQMKINMDATKFQFDFLNDDLSVLETKAPKLLEAINGGKEIIFLINPPYGTAGDFGINPKNGVANTICGCEMKTHDWGAASQQLYAQFLYRISKLNDKYMNNTKIAIFHKSIHFSGSSYKKFRANFFSKMKYVGGMLFQASHFDSVSSAWGIDFALYESGENIDFTFPHILKDLDEGMNIINMGEKNIYNLDYGYGCNKWVREETKGINTFDKPQLSSGLKCKQKGGGKLVEGGMGYFFNRGNSIMTNDQSVALFTSPYSDAHGLSIINVNYLKVVTHFTIRRIITSTHSNWINDKDEYIAPTEAIQDTLQYKQFNNDAIIYSLFNTSSNQSSMRNVDYKEKKWDIKNEFFFLPKEGMMQMADKYFFDDVYQDARSSEDRFVYKLLNGKLSDEEFKEVGITHVDANRKPILSPDAQELYYLARKLVVKSFKARKFMHEESPEFHLNTFDAGWYQIKKVLQEYYKDDYKEFTDKYKAFSDRLRPQVYELGFLLK